MWFSRCHLRCTFRCASMFIAVGITGCSNSCFVGFSNNGNGGIIVSGGNPAPACSLSQANGTMRVVLVKSRVCETCPAAHVFVTLRGIQFRHSASDDTNSSQWLELAAHLANEPRQIDLMGNSLPLVLVDSAIVPAESYREIRLQFFPESPANAEGLPAENACGETRWNCMVMANGHVEPFRFPGGVLELFIPSESIEGGSVVVLPDSRMDLLLSLDPLQGSYFSSDEGWKTQNALLGHATVVRQRSFDSTNSTLD